MKLTKEARIVLDHLIAEDSKSPARSFDTSLEAFSIDTSASLGDILDELSKEGAIEYENAYKSTFKLSSYGRRYKAILHRDFLDFLLKSVVVPIVVSLLTSGIITGVGFLWGQSVLNNQKQINEPVQAPMTEDVTVTSTS